MRGLRHGAAVLIVAAVAAGCSAPAPETPPQSQQTQQVSTVTVHRSATCVCCKEYEDYLAVHGFEVHVEVHDDMTAVKDAMGVPAELRSCHTTEIGGYIAEGHVPVEALVDLLSQQPDVAGIALPGMPAGSPGMPGEPEAPFVVTSF